MTGGRGYDGGMWMVALVDVGPEGPGTRGLLEDAGGPWAIGADRLALLAWRRRRC
jgi:hypothetical protein